MTRSEKWIAREGIAWCVAVLRRAIVTELPRRGELSAREYEALLEVISATVEQLNDVAIKADPR